MEHFLEELLARALVDGGREVEVEDDEEEEDAAEDEDEDEEEEEEEDAEAEDEANGNAPSAIRGAATDLPAGNGEEMG